MCWYDTHSTPLKTALPNCEAKPELHQPATLDTLTLETNAGRIDSVRKQTPTRTSSTNFPAQDQKAAQPKLPAVDTKEQREQPKSTRRSPVRRRRRRRRSRWAFYRSTSKARRKPPTDTTTTSQEQRCLRVHCKEVSSGERATPRPQSSCHSVCFFFLSCFSLLRLLLLLYVQQGGRFWSWIC